MMDIQKSREEFEKLSNIKRWLRFIKFSVVLGEYIQSDKPIPEYTLGFINGAWYAFQEQQKIIDLLRKQAKCHHTWHGKSENQYCSQCGLT